MTKRLPWIVTAAAFVCAIAVDVAIGSTDFPGYSALIGFAGCVGIVYLSKWFGKVLIQRSEDYYPADVQEDLHG